MSDLENNKLYAAVLVAGIAFAATGIIADKLVEPKALEHSVLKIAGISEAAAAPAAPAEKPLPPIAPLMAKADPAAGQADVQRLCSACHNFTEGSGKKVGPNLYAVLGRDIASTDFEYSSALKAKGGKWDYEALSHWLHKPSAFAEGTKMGFAGISSDATRADVIAYLRSLSHDPLPLPDASGK
jgi:cytochrome c